MLLIPPTIIENGELVIVYPTTSPTHTVTLRAPMFGNKHEHQATRINRKSIGHVQYTYSDPQWPKMETFRWQFDGLSVSQRDSLVALVKVSLGKLVRVTDYEGRIWDGLIVNPNGDLSERFQLCGYTAILDFEGTLV